MPALCTRKSQGLRAYPGNCRDSDYVPVTQPWRYIVHQQISEINEQNQAGTSPVNCAAEWRRSPGIDLIPAAAFAAMLTAAWFKRDRQLAPRLNLVPRQNSSGGTNRLYRITGQGRAAHQKRVDPSCPFLTVFMAARTR
ncbi:transposase [Rhizobium mongolense]|uniref:transposase n=1 Tax=Rhizobium mongolense TaxID=57676 RepID=UPI0034A35FD7